MPTEDFDLPHCSHNANVYMVILSVKKNCTSSTAVVNGNVALFNL